jgi:acyl-coenzyme A synthetase/AMP-(fatty) acid ligase/acyl carrier protein
MWDKYPFESSEITAARTSFSFVDSFWEIFGGVLKGVPVVIFAENVIRDPIKLLNQLEEHKVTRIIITPSLMKTILNKTKGLFSKLENLKTITFSGEALNASIVNQVMEILPSIKILNLYGSTEVTGDCSYIEINDKKRITIGKPIYNMKMYILNEKRELVSLGGIGEIYVSGVGVARGYYNNLKDYEERFVVNPFIPHFKDVNNLHKYLYRTGDLGKYHSNQEIEYIGRKDNQIKIRGIRIELEDIESNLLMYPDLEEAVVLSVPDQSEEDMLVAYIVGKGIEVTQVKDYLKEKLPSYMVPAFFILLDSLPKTENGKLDKKKLINMEFRQYNSALEEIHLPQRDIENRIAEIWKEVLKIDQISINSNFFDLGGHSLLVFEVINKINESFGTTLDIADLFEHTTISKLVNLLQKDKEHNFAEK